MPDNFINDPVPNLGLLPSEKSQISVTPGTGGFRGVSQPMPKSSPSILTAGGITPFTELPQNGRFPFFFQGADNEDLYGQAQSVGEKAWNSTVKLAGLASTTFLQGTVGMINGLAQWASTGRFSSFYDNEFTRAMDEFNKENENKFAAYYTNKEANADFFSTDNLFTANFLFDKVYKNLGFALGAMASGGAWNGALKAVGLFSKAAAAGGAVEAGIATEQAMAAPVATRMGEMVNKLKQVAEKYAYNLKTTNVAQRAIISGLATMGEASVEALEGLQTFRESAIRDYTIENGFAPQGEDLERINEAARNIGNFRFGMNAMLLSASNYIQMPKILGSSFNERKIISEFAEDIKDVKRVSKVGEAAKYEAVAPATRFGKRFKNLKDAGGLLFSWNEAMEEAGQFVIGNSVESFWAKKYEDGDLLNLGFVDTLGALGKYATSKEGLASGIANLTSKEGLESALIGGLSGGMMEARQTIADRSRKKMNTADALKAWNSSTADSYFKDLADNHQRAAVIQQEREAALRRGDFMEARNLEQDYLFTYVAPRVKYGRADLVQEEMDDIIQLTQTEEGRKVLEQRQILNEFTTPESVRKKAEQLKAAALRMQTTYETLNVRYGAQKTEEGKPKFSREALDKLVYANFKIQDYDERLPKIAGDLAAKGIIIDPYLTEADTATPEDKIKMEVLKLSVENNNKLLDTEKEEIKQAIEDSVHITKERKSLVDEYNDILKNPQNYTEGFEKPNLDKKSAATGRIKFKYDDQELEYETNTPYVAIYKEGKALDKNIVLGSEEIRILGINEDGTIKYINEKGEEKNVKKEDFEKDFRLVHPEDVKKDKELAFFINNRNQVVKKKQKVKRGKDKGKTIEIVGVLDYDYKTKTLIFQYRDSKGQIQRRGISSKLFKPAKGFFKEGVFTFANKQLTAVDWESIEQAKLNDSVKSAQDQRFNALKEVLEKSEKRKEELKEKLEDKKRELKEIQKELGAAVGILDEKRTNKNFGQKVKEANDRLFEIAFNTQMESILKLTKLKTDTENEIVQLEAEKAQIEEDLDFYYQEGEDLFDIDTTETDIDAYKETNKELEELVYEAGFFVEFLKEQIENLVKVANSASSAIVTLTKSLQDAKERFAKKYPEVSLSPFVSGVLDLSNFDLNLLAKYPDLLKDKFEMEKLISGYEIEISLNQKLIEQSIEKVQKLGVDIERAEIDLNRKQELFNKFKKLLEKKEDEQKQLKQIAENKAFHKALFEQNTNDGAPANPPGADPSKLATFETKTKPLEIVFASTTYNHEDEKDYQRRHQLFLKNSDNLENRDQMEVMFVNSEVAKNLGITGMLEEADPDGIIDQTDPQKAHLFVVYVIRSTEGEVSYMNEKGEVIGKVGDSISAKEIVFSTLPTAETNFASRDEKRYHGGTKEEADQYSALWKEQRKTLFELKGKEGVYSPFNVSRGIPVYERDEKGNVVRKRNAVEDTLVTSEALSSNKSMVYVSVAGTVNVDNSPVNVPVGTVILRNKSTIEFLDNRNFTENEVDVIYKLLKLFVKRANVIDGKFDKEILSFLHGVLYFSDNTSKDGEDKNVGRNQIYFKDGMFVIGRNKQTIPFSVSSLEENEALIKTFLRGAYMNVSNSYMKHSEKTFKEVLEVNEETGEMKTFEWKSYQHFLLSKTYVSHDGKHSMEGKTRENIPLTTSVAVPQEGQSTHVSKYSYFPNAFGFEKPKSVTEEAEKKKKEAEKKKDKKEEKEGDNFEGVEFDNSTAGVLLIKAKSTNGKTYNYKVIYDQVELVSLEDETGTPITPNEEEKKKAEEFAKKRYASLFQENPVKRKTEDTEEFSIPSGSVFANVDRKNKKLEIVAMVASNGLSVAVKDEIFNTIYSALYEQEFDEAPSIIPKNTIPKVQFKLPTSKPAVEETAKTEPIATASSSFEGTAEEKEAEERLKIDELLKKAQKTQTKPEFRRKIEGERPYVKADFEKEKSWIESKLGIPVHRLSNLIKATGGGFAWGMFKNNAIHLYEGMEEGTGYHEAFEAVWAMFLTNKEQDDLIKEFKKRKGEFIERETGKSISYKDATPDQIREQMAEELREYVLTGEMPTFQKKERKGLFKFFEDLINFIKNIFFGEPLTEATLFEKINAGYFKDALPVNSIPENEERYSRVTTIAGFNEADTYKIVKAATSFLIGEMLRDKKSIANLSSAEFDADEMYSKVFESIEDQLINQPYTDDEPELLRRKKAQTFLKIQKDWENVKTLTNEFLKTQNLINKEIQEEDFNIDEEVANETKLSEERKFDESENNDYGGRNSDSYLRNVFTIDGRLSSPAALKLMLSTIAESYFMITEDQKKLQIVSLVDPRPKQIAKPIRAKNDEHVHLPKIVNYAKMFNQLLSQMSEFTSHKEKMDRLKELRDKFPEYVRLGNRLALDTDNLTKEDWELRILFNSAFSRQNPTPLINFVDENGTYIGSADLDRESDRLMKHWIENLKTKAFDPKNELVKVNTSTGKFVFNPKELPSTVDAKNPQQVTTFLNAIGITEVSMDLLKRMSRKDSKNLQYYASQAFHFIKKKQEINLSTSKSLDVSGPLKAIANILIKNLTDASDSTYYNIEGRKVQRYVLHNTFSVILNEINLADNLSELYERLPHLRQPNSRESEYLKRVFNEQGNKIKIEGEPLKLTLSYVQGTIDKTKAFGNPRIATEKLDLKRRYRQEFNQNMEGNWYILLPGDSQTEWMISLGGSVIDFSRVKNNSEDVDLLYDIFLKYYETESEKGAIHDLMNQYGEKDLRKTIERYLQEEVEYGVQQLGEAEASSFNSDFISKYYPVNPFDTSIVRVEVKENETEQERDKRLEENERRQKVAFARKEAEIRKMVRWRAMNYAINQVEMTKLFFGDVGFYKEITKRAKSFGGQREVPFESDEFDQFANTNLNYGLKPGDPGYVDFKPVAKTVTTSSVFTNETSITDDKFIDEKLKTPYRKNESDDGQSRISMPGFKQLMIKTNRWSDEHEAQYQYILAKDRLALDEDRKLLEDDTLFSYEGREELYEKDKALVAKGSPNDVTFNIIKPIGTGFTTDNSPFVDKTSMAPISYSAYRGTNLGALYIKMWKSGLDYQIGTTGRKVIDSKVPVAPFYEKDGSINFDAFDSAAIVGIPYKFLGIQVETQGEKDGGPRGTQATKLAIVNLVDSGGEVIVGDTIERKQEIKKLIDKNTRLINEYTELGYEELLSELGLAEEEGSFTVVDRQKLLDFVKGEMEKREIPSNLKEAFALNEDGSDFAVPLETLPNYTEIKNVIFSQLDKKLVRPKMKGGPYIQMSSAGLEELGAREVKEGVLASSKLKFYEAKRDKSGKVLSVSKAQIMLPAWFGKKIMNELRSAGIKIKDEQELLAHLKESPDFNKIMEAVGFRIPTQELNSIEAFEIAGFLPSWMGSTVMVPEAIVTKAGSDFDVDKLNLYLKNIYVNSEGTISLVKYFENFEDHFVYYRDEFEKILNSKKDKIQDEKDLQFNLFNKLEKGLVYGKDIYKFKGAFEYIRGEMSNEQFRDMFERRMAKLDKKMNELNNSDVRLALIWEFVDEMRKKSLQNEYFDTLNQIITLPENFERLIQPNTSDDLKALRDKLAEINPKVFGGGRIKSILSSEFMSKLRHYFIVGKRGVGIAAVNQTNQAISQLSGVVLHPEVGNKIKIPHNKKMIEGQEYSNISGVVDKAGRYITDKISQYINGYVDISKDPFIIQIGASMNVSSIYLVMEKLGIPSETVVLFMNQPYLRRFFESLTASDKSYVNNRREFNETLQGGVQQPSVEEQDRIDAILLDGRKLNKALEDMLKKEAELGIEGLDNFERQLQMEIAEQFFLFATISENLFTVTQGTNHDTSNILDANMAHRKKRMKEKALNQHVFLNVENMLSKTHVGAIADKSEKASEAISSIFKLDSGAFRETVNKLLDIFIDNYFMGNDQFNYTGKKIEQSMLNYLVQLANRNGSTLMQDFNELLTSKKANIAAQLIELQNKMNEGKIEKFLILEKMKASVGNRVDGTNNVYIEYDGKDVFTLDLYLSSMKELKNNPHTSAFYDNLVKVNFLQTGLANSGFSFNKSIPISDFVNMVSPVLTSPNVRELLNRFLEIGGFFRNSWGDETIVPIVKPKVTHFWKKDSSRYKEFVKTFKISEEGYSVLNVGANSQNASKPYITIKRLNPKYSRKEVVDMQKVGDTSYWETVLMRRVNDPVSGQPLVLSHGNYEYVVFLPVSAWGNGARAYESYTQYKQSSFNNGTFKPTYEKDAGKVGSVGLDSAEVSDEQFMEFISGKTETFNATGEKTINVQWNADEEIGKNTKKLSNLAHREFDHDGRHYYSVEQAYQSNKNGKFDQKVYDEFMLKGGFGMKPKVPLTKEGMKTNLELMEQLVAASFVQNLNSEATKLLMEFDKFTHFGKNMKESEEIDKAFLRGLYLAQKEVEKRTRKKAENKTTKNTKPLKVETFKGYWKREDVALQTDKVFLFGDNTKDREVTKYVPSLTQAVIRGLKNAIGIDTKKDRGTSANSYFTDKDFDEFKKHVDSQIKAAINSGKTIVIPEDGIGTGKAMLKEKAPKLFNYLQKELDKLKNSSKPSNDLPNINIC